ncbi:MAG: superoxide dismutase [Ni] [Desulfobacterales bacterium]
MSVFKSVLIGLCLAWVAIPSGLDAHCEVPCGIYGDEDRTVTIAEHIQTIEKAMNEITRLGQAQPRNDNQIVRWVMTKEAHAEEIQHIVSQYFLTQRVKPGQEKTAAMLDVLHRMLVVAMKCKQTTDLQQTAELRRLLEAFEKLYFGEAHTN